MEMPDTWYHVSGRLKSFELFPGPNYGVKKLKKRLKMFFLTLFLTFLPLILVHPVTKEINTNVEHYDTCVNILVKSVFIFITLTRGSNMLRMIEISLSLPSLRNSGFVISQIATLKVTLF